MQCLPCALAAYLHPSALLTGLTAFQAGSIGLEDLHRKLACGFLLRVQGALQFSPLAFGTIPCINCIQSHLLVLLYDCFSSIAFYFFRTSELVFFFFPRNKPAPKTASNMAKSYTFFRVQFLCHLHQRSQAWLGCHIVFLTLGTVAIWQITCPYLFSPLDHQLLWDNNCVLLIFVTSLPNYIYPIVYVQ